MSSRRRRSRRISRKLLIWAGSAAAVVVVVPIVTVLVLIAMIDANAYKSRLETSLRAALGHEVQIRGALSVSASLSPRLEMDDVTVRNMAGGSRPEMMRVEHMTVELASWSLLTGDVAIERIALSRPDVLFETDASGRPNWRGEEVAAAKPAATGAAAKRTTLLAVHVRDGRATWRDGTTGGTVTAEIRRLSLTSASVEAPLIASAELYYGRQRINMSAQTGPWARLFDMSAKTPWGVFVNLDSGGAKLTVAGALTRPNEFKGYSLRLDAAAPDLGALAWLLPPGVPPMRNVTATARLLDTGGDYPDVSAVQVQTGFSNLDRVVPTLSVETLRVDMQRLSEPIVISLEGAYASTPLRVTGSLGAPSLLLPGAPAGVGYNVDLAMEAGGATLAARGAIADPIKGTGMNIALGARIPDLALLAPLIGQRLPTLKKIAFAATLADGAGGFRQEVVLREIALSLAQGDLAGEIAFSNPDRPRVRADVKSSLVDADGLLAAWDETKPTEMASARRIVRPTRAADLIAPPPMPRRGDTMIADSPLPLDWLRRFDTDIRASVRELRLYGAVYRDLAASLVLSDGRLVAGPVSAAMGGGQAGLRLSVDARQARANVGLAVKSTGVDIQPYLAGWGLLPVAIGHADIDAGLTGAGATWHELAGQLEGHVALMLRDGILDPRLARGAVADAMRGIRSGEDRVEAARMELRCLSLGLDVAAGRATVAQAGLDAVRFFGTAEGMVDLGAETAALRLRPNLRARETVVPVPLRLDGGWSQPSISPDPPAGGRVVAGSASDACPVSPFLRRVP